MNFYTVLYEKQKNNNNLAVSYICNDLSVKEYSYKDVFSLTDHYYSLLKGMGIQEGFKVALAFPNSVEWVSIYLALSKLNATAVLMDFTLPIFEFNELIKNTGLNALITNADTAKKVQDDSVACLDAFNNLKKLNKTLVSVEIDEFLIEKEVSNILFSSGTTSVPSGIMHTTYNLYSTTIDCLNENHINDDKQRFMGLLPFNHIYGLLVQLYAALISGSNVRLFETINAQTLMNTFENYKPTFLGAVPKICELLKAKIEQQAAAQKKDKLLKTFYPICFSIRQKTGLNLGKKIFSSVHKAFGGEINIISSAGAPLSEETGKFLLGLGFNLLSTYGTTETNIPMSGCRNGDLAHDTIGTPYPNIEVKINPDGEILFKGPYPMLGYYKNQEATDKILTEDGFFKTGDVGYFTKKNHLKITGRVKENIILSNGKKVFPENIEKEFIELKKVAEEYAICGKEIDGLAHSEIHLFIAGATDKTLARKKVKEINANLPTYMQIQNVHFVDSIPKTNLDKIKRFALIKGLDEKEQKEVPTNMTFEEEVIYFCLKIANLDEDYRTISREAKIFKDLGLDSLSTVSFLLEVENKYKLDLSKAPSLPKDTTIQEFLDFLKSAPKLD